MKETLISILKQSISALGITECPDEIQITRTKDPKHGDFATNIAMLLAKPLAQKPRELAEKIIAHLPSSPKIKKVEIAGPGFINFFLNENSEHDAILQAISLGEKFGLAQIGKNKKIHIEFVSANPTGPLHVGHGRGAAFGACVSNLLDAIGYKVHREYYVIYNEWFLESKLYENGWLQTGIDVLKKQNFTFEQDGALWFRATELGDEKDRVLVRANGVPTYFASDVAYHTYKYDQGYDEIIDVFGADHHGYLPRIKAFLQGLGKETNKLKILLVQFAILYRGTERVSMSTRSGEFVTLRELREEVGNDAARFFYIMRKPDQHLDFDLALAKSTSNENPVYYIQYAHARICSVWRQLSEKQLSWDSENGFAHLQLLNTQDEKNLMSAVTRFPELLMSAGQHYAPHRVAHFLQTLAQYFHAYYNAHKFIVDEVNLRNARLTLISSVQHVFKNGLSLLGVSAPDRM